MQEVFVEKDIKKGNTLQTAASQPHGGIAPCQDILAKVLDVKEGKTPLPSRTPGQSNVGVGAVTPNLSNGKGSEKSGVEQGNGRKSGGDEMDDEARHSILDKYLTFKKKRNSFYSLTRNYP